ncbi:hypothetical protein GTU73_02810 [Rathayibacter sp. VKM Ac-2804]|nr:hypothetical protein GTU73_02810 [Rathayibacter sp. VKM Ac-2804]
MNRGEFVEVGTRDQVFGAPAHPYTRSLLDSIPLSDPRQRPNAPAASPQPVSTLSEGTHRS